MDVIEVQGLSKVYRSRRGRRTAAVDGLDLAVPEGGVFGFLGPNGSGKTTTIRCLLGLAKPTDGRVRVLGAEGRDQLAEVMPRIGSLVEGGGLFPTISGRENLRLLAGLDGIGWRRVDEVLEEVGLADRAGDAVRGYSLGMRQRLGLAAALMKDPALLILDEPVNGLDPAGIREVRWLLRRLGDEGRTVFLSSHLLSEIELICDAVAVLREGRCVASGRVDDLLATAQGDRLRVRAPDLDAAWLALTDAGMVVERSADALQVSSRDPARVSEVLGSRGIWLTELRAEETSLEEEFLRLTETAPIGAERALT
ncbi:MAG TPA: ABC transporter ATP-binding protein [Acidimicrobiales bacterium]|nr:ABC transporter ATP-binding protein [Acidimicrobiales bacterium]